MRNPRARRLSVLVLALAGACTGIDDGAVTAPARDAPVAQRRVQRIDAWATSEQPVDAWMGRAPAEPMRVRVVDGEGRAVPGARVRFSVDRDGGRLVEDGNPDTAAVVLSDANGIATMGGWTLPVRDTVATRHVLVARVDGGDAANVTFVARAWRDLSRFGGTAPAVLEVMPIDRQQLAAILPLGTLGRDEALPSSDALLIPRIVRAHAVRAMADGIVTEIDDANGAVTMRVRDQVRLRLGGLTLRPEIWVGRRVRVGDTLGVLDIARPGPALAVRVVDAAVQRTHWVRAERYGARRHTAFFARYLADSVRAEAYAMVRRAAPDLDGRIDYDQDGRLVGTWFDATSPAIASGTALTNVSPFAAVGASELDPSAALAPVAMTFAYDAERPGQVRVAAGRALATALGLQGVYVVAWEDFDPADVGVGNGMVRYHLFAGDDDARIGQADRVLLAQLVDARTLRVELVPARGAPSAGFSSRAVTLVR